MGSPRSGCGETWQADSTIGTRIVAGFQYRSGIAGLCAGDIDSITRAATRRCVPHAPPPSHTFESARTNMGPADHRNLARLVKIIIRGGAVLAIRGGWLGNEARLSRVSPHTIRPDAPPKALPETPERRARADGQIAELSRSLPHRELGEIFPETHIYGGLARTNTLYIGLVRSIPFSPGRVPGQDSARLQRPRNGATGAQTRTNHSSTRNLPSRSR